MLKVVRRDHPVASGVALSPPEPLAITSVTTVNPPGGGW
jgi:hypothetical protein